MKKLAIILVFIFLFTGIKAQESSAIPSSVTIANLGTADTKNWSAFSNPSNISHLKNSGFGFQYENRFLLSEISTKSLYANFPSKLVDIGLSASYFGFNLYNELMLGVGFSRNFADKFSLGFQLNYNASYLGTELRYHGVIFPQVGLNISLTPNFHLGFATFNPFQQNIIGENIEKRVASIFSLGCEYFFSQDLVMRAQLDKELSANYRFGAAFDYTILDFLTVKLGAYNQGYLVPCLGLSIEFGSFSFGYNGNLHPLLGLVSNANIYYKFGHK